MYHGRQKIKLILCAAAAFIILLAAAVPTFVSATTTNPITFIPQIGIPGFIKQGEQIALVQNNTSYIARMVKGFYEYGLSIGGILAAIVLMAAGIIWLTSGGSSDKIGQAKGLIAGSLTGLLLLFGSWIILNTINPYLLDMKITTIRNMQPINLGCCEYKNEAKADKAEMMSDENCAKKSGTFKDKIDQNDGTVSYYNVNKEKTKCTIPGCCVSQANDGKILDCSDTMDYACNGKFFETKCSFLSQCGAQTDSSGSSYVPNQDICDKAGVEDGDDCFEESGHGICHCYNKIAWHNDGQAGEPCGNDGGICTVVGFNNPCPGTLKHDKSLSARRCSGGFGSGLRCCTAN